MGLDSMFIGVTGLEAYQNQIDVVSNNIANVGTTGYKGQDVNFEDLLYQAQSFATAPSADNGGVNGQDIGLGVKIGSIDSDMSQGGLETTGVNTNLAMDGDGFFILKQPGGSGSPVYTRNGDFSLNANGLLYDPSSGMAVQGYSANANGVISATGTPGDITIPIGLQAQAVATGSATAQKYDTKTGGDDNFDVQTEGNLDQTLWAQQAQDVQKGTTTTVTPYTTSETIYDSLGNAHLATVTYTPDATGATAGTVAAAPAEVNPPLTSAPTSNVISSIDASGATSAAAITVKINTVGTVTSATVSDGTNTVTGASGATVDLDGTKIVLGSFTAADAGLGASFSTTASSSGLPAQVANANGVLVNAATRWQVSVSFADGTQFDAIGTPGSVTTAAPVPPATTGVTTTTAAQTTQTSSGIMGYAYFDQNGQFINTSSIEGTDGTSLTAAQTHQAGSQASIADGNQLNIVSWGVGNTDNSVAPTAGGVAPKTGPIAYDFSYMTSLSNTTAQGTTGGLAGPDAKAINGYAAGSLTNITIGDDGTITGAFSNGQSRTLAQVAVASFANEQGLTRVGGSDFASSANSGIAQVGTASTGNLGEIVSGSLEESNVSIADEFTKMITAQNAYQANSKSITTASEDMQTVIGLIR